MLYYYITNLSRLCLWTIWLEQGWIQKAELRAINRPERLFSPGVSIPFCSINCQFTSEVRYLNVLSFVKQWSKPRLANRNEDKSWLKQAATVMLLFRKWYCRSGYGGCEGSKVKSRKNWIGRPMKYVFTSLLIITKHICCRKCDQLLVLFRIIFFFYQTSKT